MNFNVLEGIGLIARSVADVCAPAAGGTSPAFDFKAAGSDFLQGLGLLGLHTAIATEMQVRQNALSSVNNVPTGTTVTK